MSCLLFFLTFYWMSITHSNLHAPHLLLLMLWLLLLLSLIFYSKYRYCYVLYLRIFSFFGMRHIKIVDWIAVEFNKHSSFWMFKIRYFVHWKLANMQSQKWLKQGNSHKCTQMHTHKRRTLAHFSNSFSIVYCSFLHFHFTLCISQSEFYASDVKKNIALILQTTEINFNNRIPFLHRIIWAIWTAMECRLPHAQPHLF